VPRLWNETIEEHRRAVHDATLDALTALLAEHGLASVTMSGLAEAAGIGRATLYKYFPDIESVLLAWHDRQAARELAVLTRARDAADGPAARLRAVLSGYALIRRDEPGAGLLAVPPHRGEHAGAATQPLHALLSDLIADCAQAGDIPPGVPPGELASYCLHALGAAASLPSPEAVSRLVAVTLAGLTGGNGPPATAPHEH
jgi:AcrR family transcriptional regulator